MSLARDSSASAELKSLENPELCGTGVSDISALAGLDKL